MSALVVREMGRQPYEATWEAMRALTDRRDADSPDELWLLEHPPVYTQGLAGKPEHLLNPGGIPLVQTDRGGQITYHGPGQLVGYPLLDLNRLGIGVRTLVNRIEQSIIDTLADLDIAGLRREKAPGVFVGDAKIASIGLKVRKGCTYHGLAFNVDMDLAPFAGINPCGFAGLDMCRVCDFVPDATVPGIGGKLSQKLQPLLGYDRLEHSTDLPDPLQSAVA